MSQAARPGPKAAAAPVRCLAGPAGHQDEPAKRSQDHLQPASQQHHVQIALRGQHRHTETGEERPYQPRDDRSVLRSTPDG